MQIETKLHKRKGAAVTNFAKKLPLSQSDLAQSTLKNPYLFDFLSLGDKAQEQEVEKGLVKHIEKFLLEPGEGFAFLGRQYHSGDNPSIGLILCRSKVGVLAEYALRDMTKSIGLAEYRLEDSLPDDIKTSLPTIEELESELSKRINSDEDSDE